MGCTKETHTKDKVFANTFHDYTLKLEYDVAYYCHAIFAFILGSLPVSNCFKHESWCFQCGVQCLCILSEWMQGYTDTDERINWFGLYNLLDVSLYGCIFNLLFIYVEKAICAWIFYQMYGCIERMIHEIQNVAFLSETCPLLMFFARGRGFDKSCRVFAACPS